MATRLRARAAALLMLAACASPHGAVGQPPTVLPTIVGRRHIDPAPARVARPAVREVHGHRAATPTMGGREVRVALARDVAGVTIGSDGPWTLSLGGSEARRLDAGDLWAVEARQGGVAAHGRGGDAVLGRGVLVARPSVPEGTILLGGRWYRGEVRVVPSTAGLLVIDAVPLEDYLRGVVPLELGDAGVQEAAAAAAQAVAARSYTVQRLESRAERRAAFDVVATVTDQVYGGVDAERPASDAAVSATGGEVLTYAGRVINAPYHSTCGGSTAEADEVWSGEGGEPYLRRVSDRIPGSDRFYCDVAPRFAWTASFNGPQLRAALDRYLRSFASVPSSGVGAVRSVAVAGVAPSGRVAALDVVTEAGRYTLRGNQIRYVLRSPGGEILNSTYFSVAASEKGRDGDLSQLTLRGAGNGHGIGMCQWGAIGRARAGQDYRTILAAYYPGTTLSRVR